MTDEIRKAKKAMRLLKNWVFPPPPPHLSIPDSVKIVKRNPTHKHLIVVNSILIGEDVRALMQMQGINATLFFGGEPLTRRILQSNDVLVMLKSRALTGWRFDSPWSYHFIPLCRLSSSETTQLFARAHRHTRVMWSPTRAEIMSSWQENVGVWYDEEPILVKYKYKDFARGVEITSSKIE